MPRTSIRELIAAGGVILSLLFVGLEIRANTNAVRGATIQGISDQSITVTLAIPEIPELRSGHSKVLAGRDEELTMAEEDAVTQLYAAAMRISENRFRQLELGVLDSPSSVGGGSALYRVPFFRAYWATRGSEYPDDFVEYVERVLLPLAQDSVPRIIQRSSRHSQGRWRASRSPSFSLNPAVEKGSSERAADNAVT